MSLPYKFILIFVILNVSKAYAFPEMIKDGYQYCIACHYQSNGGGPLNAYGRTIAGEHLSTFGTAERGGPGFGIFDLSPLFDVAADYRYLVHHYDDKDQPQGVRINQRFPMQKEVSLILNAAENVSFVVSGGQYGFESSEVEYRRYFGVVRLGAFSMRLGRFLPAFGYNIADHTKSIKDLFGQGDETLNAELSYSSTWAQVTATRVSGGDSSIGTGRKPKITQTDARDGFALASVIPIAKGFQLGSSIVELSDSKKVQRYTAYSAFAGNSFVYSLFEYQSHPNKAYRAYGEIGWQFVKGMHLKAEYSGNETTKEWFGTLDLYPYPHFQMTISMSQMNRIFVFHFYL